MTPGADRRDLFRRLDKTLSAARQGPLSRLNQLQLRALCVALPKVDLHRHLEGAITPETLIKVARKHQVELPTYEFEELRPMLQMTDADRGSEELGLKIFLSKFELIGKIFKSLDVIEDISFQVTKDCADDNLRYAELRFSPMYMAKTHGLDLEETVEAVVRGLTSASQRYNIPVRQIVIVDRQMGLENAWLVEQLASRYVDHGVVALDLANNEYDHPPGPFREVFQKAKRDGLRVTVHAGEVPVHHEMKNIGGAHNVRVAIEELGADRIGHGVRTRENPDVESLVIEKQIPLELCPTSNVQTQATESMESHPIRYYYEKGAKVTLNNDDPAVSGITLSDDFQTVCETFDFSLHDLKTFVLNGVESAFTDATTKRTLTEEIEDGFAAAEMELFESLTLGELTTLALAGAESHAARQELNKELRGLTS